MVRLCWKIKHLVAGDWVGCSVLLAPSSSIYPGGFVKKLRRDCWGIVDCVRIGRIVQCDMFVMGLSVLQACPGCTVMHWDLGDLLPFLVPALKQLDYIMITIVTARPSL